MITSIVLIQFSGSTRFRIVYSGPKDGLYRICFYSSQEIADKSLTEDFLSQGESRMYRCPKEAVLSCAFSESWDDGFNEGVAYLFWCQEKLNENNTEYSLSGISIEYFDVLTQGEWIPLVEYLDNTASTANEKVSVAKDIINTPLLPEKEHDGSSDYEKSKSSILRKREIMNSCTGSSFPTGRSPLIYSFKLFRQCSGISEFNNASRFFKFINLIIFP